MFFGISDQPLLVVVILGLFIVGAAFIKSRKK